MNRIRKFGDIYQVLITPNIQIAPDSSLMIGNWEDEELRNFYILEFPTLNEAQCEAFKHPDINWYRIVLNHEHIYERLKNDLQFIINKHNFNVEFIPNLMNPTKFKNVIFDRVMQHGERFNLRYGANDIISFTIVNPWTNNLHKLSKNIEFHREHLYRNDMRIQSKRIVDNKTICLYGYTEFGTIFEIKLMPTLLYQWFVWSQNNTHHDHTYVEKLYRLYLQKQNLLDKGPILR